VDPDRETLATAGLLPQQRLFLAQFDKDLAFFKLFFLLANKSRLIRHLSVLWARDGPAAQIGLSQVVGTEDAFETPCSQYVQCDPQIDPDFCRIVNDHGRHEAESCRVSDRIAEKRCRDTGTTQIYTCHAGLIDIAVPVSSNGQYIGTLLCGQMLRTPPSAAGFQEIRRNVAALTYIDLAQLETAYWKMPVSSDSEIQTIVQLLEAFAEYLATSWGRLSDLVREQHRTIRESQLLRMEFAHLVLDGTPADRASLRELVTRLGFTLVPNRVLVVQLEPESHQLEGTASFDVRFTAALQVIEEICDAQANRAVAYLRKRGISVFYHDAGAGPSHSVTHHAHGLARRILDGIDNRCGLRARIGIGSTRPDLRDLVQSYDEACMALAQSPEAIAAYQKPAAPREDLTSAAEKLCACLSARKLSEARLAIDALSVLAGRRLGQGPTSLGAQRQFLCSTLYSLCFCAKQLGADRDALDRVLWQVDTEMHTVASLRLLHEAYQRFATTVLEEVRKLYTSRHDKLVDKACRIIDEIIEQGDSGSRISPSQVAPVLLVSVSHLGRTFRQVTGMTFERFVMKRRVDSAKGLLLNPAYNVSQVADKCGFSDPAYFARVFRRLAGCSPREYMRDPLHWEGQSRDSGPQASNLAKPCTAMAPRRSHAL
jgi:AraC-like DNA-binding protein